MSPQKKEKPALNQPLQLKQAGRGTPLCLGLQEPLNLTGRTLPTSTVISRSRLDLSNYPCTPQISVFAVSDVQLLRVAQIKMTLVFTVPTVGSTGRYKPARSEPSVEGFVLGKTWVHFYRVEITQKAKQYTRLSSVLAQYPITSSLEPKHGVFMLIYDTAIDSRPTAPILNEQQTVSCIKSVNREQERVGAMYQRYVTLESTSYQFYFELRVIWEDVFLSLTSARGSTDNTAEPRADGRRHSHLGWRNNEIKIVERGCCLMGDCSLSDPVIATDYEAFSPHFNCYRGLLSPNSAW
ncbi:hypothetical protein J6590_099422 [Homalodisca vitripennis]|nr:hypothetical protein J6590_099422 [Homalodisca vitripennis]